MRIVITLPFKAPFYLFCAMVGFASLAASLVYIAPDNGSLIFEAVFLSLVLAACMCLPLIFLTLFVLAYGRSAPPSSAEAEEEPSC